MIIFGWIAVGFGFPLLLCVLCVEVFIFAEESEDLGFSSKTEGI